MTTLTLITGANKSLGYETARRLLGEGHTVLLGARDAQRGQAAADELGAIFVRLDVTSDASVDAAAAWVRDTYGHLDVLVNNAGILGPLGPLAEMTAADVAVGLETNVLGVARMTRAFAPLLALAENPRIVNVSSGVGSFARNEESGTDEASVPPSIYSVTKAALTMLTYQYARALPGMRVNAADPGYTGTAFNNFSGHQSVEEGTDAIVRLATLAADGPTGTFQSRHGIVPW
ncbi:SDR family NAD(P)-dependent oxidoreductase [Cryobacterium sp. SO2]|uniref:SDR family NAD(P)-dependent oxidoreductase n=1 Tax=Cryobacterium sp. SO2 TaxID=1897060 RepID=UPI00223D081A|nr:SDR family NAD(P)-dependent oxidoreductase [Cryobacterium sp. SO2]WEO77212.1 SDR family NAD(P)-dependent oxidoreductase [Cryobacterium sp. SO2]